MDALSRDMGTGGAVAAARLRRAWPVVLVGVAIGLALAFLYASVQEPQYRSSAEVQVLPTGTTDRSDREVDVDTEVQLVRSEAVAEIAQGLLKTSTPAIDLRQAVEVSVPPNTKILQISYVAPTAKAAQQGAHAFAAAYISARTAAAKDAVGRETEKLQAELKALNKELTDVSGRIAALPADSEEGQLAQSQRTLVLNQITQVQSRLAPLSSASTVGGTLINDATEPTAPAGLSKAIIYGSGAMAGLLLGVGLALLTGRRDGPVRRADDVERRLGVPVLAEIPRGRRSEAATIAASGSPAGHAYGELRNELVSNLEPGGQVVVVMSATPAGTASGVVAANLAVSLARLGHSVAVVVADPRSTATSVLNVPDTRGLADALRGDAGIVELLRPVAHGGGTLRVCPAGRGLDEQSELVQSPRMRDLLTALQRTTDYVVVSAAATSSETQSLARIAGAAVVVGEWDRTRSKQLGQALRHLERARVALPGIVLAPAAGSAAPSSTTPREAAAPTRVVPPQDGARAVEVLPPHVGR